MLPAFADVLRKELGLPVFDHTSLVDMVHPSPPLPHHPLTTPSSPLTAPH